MVVVRGGPGRLTGSEQAAVLAPVPVTGAATTDWPRRRRSMRPRSRQLTGCAPRANARARARSGTS